MLTLSTQLPSSVDFSIPTQATRLCAHSSFPLCLHVCVDERWESKSSQEKGRSRRKQVKIHCQRVKLKKNELSFWQASASVLDT